MLSLLCCRLGWSLPEDVTENVLRKVLHDNVLRGSKKKEEWNRVWEDLQSTCKHFEGVVQRIEYKTGFADLNWKCKNCIFRKAVNSMALSNAVAYKDQVVDCKRFVQCKTVSKAWKYWISRTTSGVEMRKNIIDIDT